MSREKEIEELAKPHNIFHDLYTEYVHIGCCRGKDMVHWPNAYQQEFWERFNQKLDAGYHKPSEADVEKIAKIVCKAIKYGDCCEHKVPCLRGDDVCESVNYYVSQILPLMSPKPELKLISDEEIQRIEIESTYPVYNGTAGCKVDLRGFVKNLLQAQLQADKKALERE